MTYARHVGAAVAGAVLAVVVWTVWLFARAAMDVARLKASGAGVGSASVMIDSNDLLVAAGIGFAAGWYWRVWRSRR